jgi:hypothetical protein
MNFQNFINCSENSEIKNSINLTENNYTQNMGT